MDLYSPYTQQRVKKQVKPGILALVGSQFKRKKTLNSKHWIDQQKTFLLYLLSHGKKENAWRAMIADALMGHET